MLSKKEKIAVVDGYTIEGIMKDKQPDIIRSSPSDDLPSTIQTQQAAQLSILQTVRLSISSSVNFESSSSKEDEKSIEMIYI